MAGTGHGDRDQQGRGAARARRVDILAQYPSSRRFVIGALDASSKACFDAPDFSLSRFLLTPPPEMSIVTRTGLRAWVAPVFTQFQTFELQTSMQGAQFL